MPTVQFSPSGITDLTGTFHPYGAWADAPLNESVSDWLKGAARDTVELLHQAVYIFAHPGSEEPSFPSSYISTDPWIRAFAVEQLIQGIIQGGTTYYGDSATHVSTDLHALFGYCLWFVNNHQSTAGESWHVPDSVWALFGSMNDALTMFDPNTLPPA